MPIVEVLYFRNDYGNIAMRRLFVDGINPFAVAARVVRSNAGSCGGTTHTENTMSYSGHQSFP